MQQSQQAVFHHSSQLKQQIQTACDSALLQLRQQEQQLLREVDAAASQQWQLLWTGCQLPDSRLGPARLAMLALWHGKENTFGRSGISGVLAPKLLSKGKR